MVRTIRSGWSKFVPMRAFSTLVLLVCCGFIYAQVNLVKNGGFEKYT